VKFSRACILWSRVGLSWRGEFQTHTDFKNAGGMFDTVYYQQGRRSDLHEVSLSIPTNRHSGIKIHALCSRISIKFPSIIPLSRMQCTSTQLCSASAASTLIHQCRLPSAAAQLWCIIPGHSLAHPLACHAAALHACMCACVCAVRMYVIAVGPLNFVCGHTLFRWLFECTLTFLRSHICYIQTLFARTRTAACQRMSASRLHLPQHARYRRQSNTGLYI